MRILSWQASQVKFERLRDELQQGNSKPAARVMVGEHLVDAKFACGSHHYTNVLGTFLGQKANALAYGHAEKEVSRSPEQPRHPDHILLQLT